MWLYWRELRCNFSHVDCGLRSAFHTVRDDTAVIYEINFAASNVVWPRKWINQNHSIVKPNIDEMSMFLPKPKKEETSESEFGQSKNQNEKLIFFLTYVWPTAYQMAENERKVWHPVVWQQPPPPVEEFCAGEVRTIWISDLAKRNEFW